MIYYDFGAKVWVFHDKETGVYSQRDTREEAWVAGDEAVMLYNKYKPGTLARRICHIKQWWKEGMLLCCIKEWFKEKYEEFCMHKM